MTPRRAKDQAMAHQKVSLAHDEKTDCVFDCSDAGTGKTFVRIMAFAKRRKRGGGKALVLCTRSTMHNAWLADFRKFAPEIHVVVAEAKNRKEALAIDADVYVVNHDAVKELVKMPKQWFAAFSELIIDESTAYKNPTPQRSKAAAKIATKYFFKPKAHRACMTATPNPVTICNVWHQVYLLDGGQRLGPSYFGFRNSTCEPRQVGKSAHAIQWEDKIGAEDAVFGLLSDIVIRHKLDDCADIPQTYHHSVEFNMTDGHRKTYNMMEQTQLLTFLPDIVAAKLTGDDSFIKVTAVNAAAVLTKLLQVASGAVYTDNGQYRVVAPERYELIMDLVEERPHALVFFQWQHQKEQLLELATKRNKRFGVMDGKTGDTARQSLVSQYQDGKLDVLFAHPRTAAHGLTLTRGKSIIWCGPTWDLEVWEQGNKRQRRIGQKEKTEVIVVRAPGTQEDRVYDMLMKKDARMKSLMSLFESIAQDVKAKGLKKAA